MLYSWPLMQLSSIFPAESEAHSSAANTGWDHPAHYLQLLTAASDQRHTAWGQQARQSSSSSPAQTEAHQSVLNCTHRVPPDYRTSYAQIHHNKKYAIFSSDVTE